MLLQRSWSFFVTVFNAVTIVIVVVAVLVGATAGAAGTADVADVPVKDICLSLLALLSACSAPVVCPLLSLCLSLSVPFCLSPLCVG